MKITLKIFLLSTCLLYVFSSCVTSRHTDLLQDISIKYPTITNPEAYKIIAGDELNITVYALDPEVSSLFRGYSPTGLTRSQSSSNTGANIWDLVQQGQSWSTRSTRVFSDGTINFPYIGKVYVQDLTLLETRKIISQKLNAFAEGTSADVALSNSYFSILGEASPQRVLMPRPKINIYEALTLGSQINPYGDKSKVVILRQTKDGTAIKTFDLRSKDIIDTDYFYIQANDVIYVPQMGRKFLGSTNSFTGVFALLSSLAGIITFAVRLF